MSWLALLAYQEKKYTPELLFESGILGITTGASNSLVTHQSIAVLQYLWTDRSQSCVHFLRIYHSRKTLQKDVNPLEVTSFIELHSIRKKYSHKFDGSHIVYTNVVLVDTSALACARSGIKPPKPTLSFIQSSLLRWQASSWASK